jgi:REP element-mobilizing transposase RayT
MARNIRDRRNPNNRVVHITNRVWKGLPFVPNRLTNRIIKGVIARAQNLYKVNIVAYVFMPNHYHFIIAGDANRVSSFICYIDGELARKFMKLLPNIWGSKFWVGRFKEQQLITQQDVINKISYIFNNPVSAELVSKVSDYPGISSFKDIESHEYKNKELCSFTFAKNMKPLPNYRLSKIEEMRIVKEHQRKSSFMLELETKLLSWLHMVEGSLAKEQVVDEIKKQIKETELVTCNKKVFGKEKLKSQSYVREYYPKKKGITVFIECCDRELRRFYIDSYNEFRRACKLAWEKIKKGYQAEWPRGANKPSYLAINTL